MPSHAQADLLCHHNWDQLLINLDYKLGCKIIIKSLLHNLFWESGRRKWLEKLKKYIPVSKNFELVIDKDKIYSIFRFPGQAPVYGDDMLKFYESLLTIYQTHPVFFNDKATEITENGRERITRICKYLEAWKQETILLDDYILLRKTNYSDKLQSMDSLLQNYKNNNSSNDLNHLKQIFNEIEKQELQAAALI